MRKKIENKVAEVFKRCNVLSASDIDLEKIAKVYGVTLKSSDLDDSISGFFVIKDDAPHIAYNQWQSNVRNRFTIAHEFGHFLLHKMELSLSQTQLPIYRDGMSSTGEIKMEREANLFAATLLMPEEFINAEMAKSFTDKNDRLDYLASKFGVSGQAMSYRLAYLGYDMSTVF